MPFVRVRFAVVVPTLALLGAGCVRSLAVPPPTAPEAPPAVTTPAGAPEDTRVVDFRSLPGAHVAFAAQLTIPATWEIEVIPELEAVNLYDPAAPGATPREQSQVFLRHFQADDFLTLSAVTIHERAPTTVAGRPAVTYVIEKKTGVPAFPDQPSWRNVLHRVTDVRLSDARPSEFLVIGQRPGLSDAVFDAILDSLRIAPSPTVSLVPPARDFFVSITKKPFGIFITPETSPVQPERFRGYHTGADAELPADTPVVAIAGGLVVRSGRVSGYGGLVVLEHEVAGERVRSLSGHLDPASLTPVGSSVRAGQPIGKLGDASSAETDGARAHLHFGLYRGRGVNVAGYASTKEALAAWYDPVEFLRAHGTDR